MIPLHHEPWYTFRFGDDRIIPRFHLEGLREGVAIRVIRIDPTTLARKEELARAIVGADGWVDLPAPLRVRAGEAFIAVID